MKTILKHLTREEQERFLHKLLKDVILTPDKAETINKILDEVNEK